MESLLRSVTTVLSLLTTTLPSTVAREAELEAVVEGRTYRDTERPSTSSPVETWKVCAPLV